MFSHVGPGLAHDHGRFHYSTCDVHEFGLQPEGGTEGLSGCWGLPRPSLVKNVLLTPVDHHFRLCQWS
jgi:hypothetical protein